MPVSPLLRRAATTEAAMWRSLYLWARRRPVVTAPGDAAFSYLGVVRPILGVFIGLSVVEIPILDLSIRKVVPWAPARWIMLVLSVWGLLWMIGLYASLKLNPHVVGPAGIRVRSGASLDVTVAWADVESVTKAYRSLPSSRSVQVEPDATRTVLNLPAGSQTSVDVKLRRPVSFALPKGKSAPADEIRFYADDPEGFVRACRPGPGGERATMRHAQES